MKKKTEHHRYRPFGAWQRKASLHPELAPGAKRCRGFAAVHGAVRIARIDSKSQYLDFSLSRTPHDVGLPAAAASRLSVLTLRFCLTFLFVFLLPSASPAQGSDPLLVGQQVVVKLFGAGVGTLDSYGSGVLVSKEGHFITVWNHLVNTGYLTAVLHDGQRFSVEVVGTSADHDLAVLKLVDDDDQEFPFADLKTDARPAPGESVLAFSNMFHVATGNEPVSVVHGVLAGVSDLDAGLGRWQFPVKSPVLLIDAVTNNSGAGGGLLTNQSGQPLGLLGREIRHRETGMWVNYAVPWSTLRKAATSIIQGQRVSSSKKDDEKKMVADRRLTSAFGLTLIPAVVSKTPAYIDRIVPDSPAAKAGLKRGDLILMVNDDVIQSTDEFRAAVAAFRRGQRVSLTVNRDGSLETGLIKVP